MATPTVYTPKALFDPVLIGNSTTLLYTASTSLGTQVYNLLLLGVTVATIPTVTMWLVPSGGVPGKDNEIAHEVAPGEDGLPMAVLPQGAMTIIEAGATIWAKAFQAGCVACHGSGVELE